MTPPVYQDDSSISDGDRLFRRVHRDFIVRDENTGLARVSSGVFRAKELSVNIESVLKMQGCTPEACLHDYDKAAYSLVSITAGDARKLNQAVFRDPLPDNLSHGIVYGTKNNKKIPEGLQSAAVWVIPPTPPVIDDLKR